MKKKRFYMKQTKNISSNQIKSNRFYLKSARYKQYKISSQSAFEPTYINIT
jgi:hypothetical protein